ncbi:hypothetical protein IWQ61_005134, partial [Dispira simplex]
GTKAIVEASDHGQVMVSLIPHNTFGTKFVEIIGQVQPDRSLQEFSSCNMGDNFDLPTYNKLVELSHRYKELFE